MSAHASWLAYVCNSIIDWLAKVLFFTRRLGWSSGDADIQVAVWSGIYPLLAHTYAIDTTVSLI
jgi:hypothetical protein